MFPASETMAPHTVNLTVPQHRSGRYLTEKETISFFSKIGDGLRLALYCGAPFIAWPPRKMCLRGSKWPDRYPQLGASTIVRKCR